MRDPAFTRDEVRALCRRMAAVGWAPEPPRGAERLGRLVASP